MMKKITLILSLLTSVSVFAQSDIKTTVFGDLRARHESVEAEGAARENYDYLRLRARLGVKAQINETLSSEFRMATGTGGTATNQTFSGGSRNYNFLLDRAYFKYSADENTVVRAGRTDNPYVTVGDNSMLFDADLNFDGASVNYTHKMEAMSLQVVLAHTILQESTDSAVSRDSSLESAQLALRFGGDVHNFLLTVSEHAFMGLKGKAAVPAFSGNSANGTNYRYNYDVTAVGFEYGFKGELPITVFAEMAKNNRTSREDMATIYGVKLSKVKKKGDWMLSVDSREVESDSTLGSLTDGDSFGGGTNGTSLNASAAYGLGDNSNFMVSYFTGKANVGPGETKLDRNRAQVDLNVKF